MPKEQAAKKTQVLLIESDHAFANEIAGLLKSHGYKADLAFSGMDGLQRLERVPDLAIVNASLPDMRGIQLCQQNKNNEKSSHVPILFISDGSVSAEEMETVYIYCEDHIVKPFEIQEFVARVEVILRHTKVSQQAKAEKEIVTNELKRILSNELIVPHFQPIFSMKTKKLLGVEALSRPATDTFLSNPELFFKAALTFGMYTEMEKLAWRKAFAQWKAQSGKGKLFLNCIPQFIGNNVIDKDFFAAMGIDPQVLVVELTERTAIHDHVVFVDKLNGLRYLGIEVAVDDVGSGFASLDTVAEVKPDYVKIDLSLVCDIHFDSLKRNIVQSIISFCHQSNIITVAEGIEKEEELKIVQDLGIDAVQGFFLGRPSQDISEENPF